MEPLALGLGNLPSQQAAAFAGAVCMGAGVALAYDLLRLLRMLWRGKVWGSVVDIAYWVAVAVSVLGYTVELTGGEVEVYVAVAMLLGGWLYFRFLSPPVRRCEGVILAVCGKIWEIITFPARVTGRGLKNFWNFAKKHFHFSQRWFTIIKPLGALHRKPRGNSAREGGVGWYESQESGHAHQAAVAHFAGSRHDHLPQSALPSEGSRPAAGRLGRGR